MNATELLIHRIKDQYYFIDYEKGMILGLKDDVHFLIFFIIFLVFLCYFVYTIELVNKK